MSPKSGNDHTVAPSDGDKKITKKKWNPFFLRKQGGEPTPEGWRDSELPDGSEVALAPSSVTMTKSRADISDEELEMLKSSDPERGRWAVIFDDGNQIVLGRRYAPPSKKSGEEPRRDPPAKVEEVPKVKKSPRPVRNPCGFSGCKAPRNLCEGLKRHYWATTPPPVKGGQEEEAMITPPATPMGGPTLDPSTWFRAHEVDAQTQVKIEEIRAGTAMHGAEVPVRIAGIDAEVIKHKTDAEVTMHGRKFDHLDKKLELGAASERMHRADRADDNRRSAIGLGLALLGAGVLIFFGWLATLKDNGAPVEQNQVVNVNNAYPEQCNTCPRGVDPVVTTTTTVPPSTTTTVPGCICTTTTVPPRTTTTTVPPSTTTTTVPPSTTTTTVPPTTTTTTVPPSTTTTTVPPTTTTTIPGGCSGNGCPTTTTIPGGCSGNGCPKP